MKKFLVLLISIISLLCLVGCTSSNGQIKNTDTSSNEVSAKVKHVVSLTKDNYQKFLTVEINHVVDGEVSIFYHYFRGALSYAFYDNVIITYDYSSGNTTTEENLLLNVGGCGTIETDSSRFGTSRYIITNVSGTITYRI